MFLRSYSCNCRSDLRPPHLPKCTPHCHDDLWSKCPMSKVLKSIIGKYKYLQGEHGQFDVTGMLLSIGASTGRLTLEGIRKASTTISGQALRTWEATQLGAPLQSQREQAFLCSPPGTEPGTIQPALTLTE